MKLIIALGITALSFRAGHQLNPAPKVLLLQPVALTDTTVYTNITTGPEFPGGMTNFVTLLLKETQYPPKQVNEPLPTKLTIKFIVEKDGSLSNIELGKNESPVFDTQILKALKKLPHWKPAIKNGHPVRCKWFVPISCLMWQTDDE